ncbi:N-acetylglucosamine-6-phosphate deacetylase [Tateyamaria pelophila]|uniref:N-acetylglucosamine-6-phosphate deacetylase n=1 Tax=Tateyamaria pelophila TaxID=328415 RepID=UPI001CBBCC29|nr:N-acetylglucosamine-6-phosphate deacetylase [Tateyamaria pelophila]
MSRRAYLGADIFDGTSLLSGKALVLDGTRIDGIVAPDSVPPDVEIEPLDGGTLMPGFVDLQVNGGGGVMFNDETNAQGVAQIARAHATTGTAALLPTLITDTRDKTRAAVDAVEEAIAQGVPGILGVHLEGPHLSVARKGAHDPALIRAMEDVDEAFLCEAARRLPNVMVTVALESTTYAQIARLSDAGVIVSLGHTDCSYGDAVEAFASGARCVTHLFNAMSQMGNRAPGLVGAALSTPGIAAGLIADNIHVHAGSMRAALAANSDIFLVTDAMSTVGSDIAEFLLNGRKVLRQNGRLTLQDGTLAGADLEFSKALSVLIETVGLEPARAFAMTTTRPAALLRDALGFGRFDTGQPGPVIYLNASHRFERYISA